jgi:hypothetical protein
METGPGRPEMKRAGADIRPFSGSSDPLASTAPMDSGALTQNLTRCKPSKSLNLSAICPDATDRPGSASQRKVVLGLVWPSLTPRVRYTDS